MSDPFNHDATAVYATPVRLAPQVRRITVRNPSPMTFTGTQTYLAGTGDIAVIDPGPENAEHLDALLAAPAAGERIAAILVTHTHVDHSPGARALQEATGAPTYGFGPHGDGMSGMMAGLVASGASFGGGEGADRRFAPDVAMADGDVLELGGVRLRALHTPGHLSNHLSFALEEGEADLGVFSGDLLMGWATTMISPPDGDMAAFMASLERMAARRDPVFWPGHGHPVEDPQGMIAHQTAHRRGREADIAAALAETPGATPAELTARIYADVDKALHAAAARNVFAHLLGLIAEGRAAAEGEIAPDAGYRLL